MAAPDETSWPERLFRKSVLKQQKLRELCRCMGETGDRTCLDLGSDNGVISLLLRRRGGRWHSADLDPVAVASIRSLVGTNVEEVREGRLPYPDATFDVVCVVDMLEHLDDDDAFAGELARVLRPHGMLVTNVPHYKRFSPLRGIRKLLGQTDAKHGHVRPGYTRKTLRSLLEGRFAHETDRTYSGFFSELIDTMITFGYGLLKKGDGGSKGVLVTGDDMRKMRKSFRMYSLVYPVVKAFSLLDRLFFFLPGNMLIARWHRADGKPEA